MSSSFRKDIGKKVSMGTSPSAPGPKGLNVLKRNGTVQPFDKNKLVNSISKAGATPQQATLVSDRVVARLPPKQTIQSSQLSSMVARSLSRVNPTAATQYTIFRDQKLGSPLSATGGGAPTTPWTTLQSPSPSTSTIYTAPTSPTAYTGSTPGITYTKPKAPTAATPETFAVTQTPPVQAYIPPKPVTFVAAQTPPVQAFIEKPDLTMEIKLWVYEGLTRMKEIVPGSSTVVVNSKQDLTLYVRLMNVGNKSIILEVLNPGGEQWMRTPYPLLSFQIPEVMNAPHFIYDVRSIAYNGVAPFEFKPYSKSPFIFIDVSAILYNKNEYISSRSGGQMEKYVNGGKPLPPGKYTVKVVADPENRIDESNKHNNECMFSFEITAPPEIIPPDLVIADLQVETSPNLNDQSTIILTIANQGKGKADFGTMTYYQMERWLVEILGLENITLVSSPNDIPVVQPGGFFQLKYRTYIPLTPATYLLTININLDYFVDKANPDRRRAVLESNYNNNTAKYEIVIGENRKVLSINRK